MDLNLCAVLKCTEQPFIQHPLLLCRQHALMVSLNVTDVLHANALAGHAAIGLDVERASVCTTPVWDESSHPSVVYFLVNGDRVKIGTSTNITARVCALSLRRNNAALLLQGGNDLESALHKHFGSDRIGQTEWFVLSQRIQDYIACRKEAAAMLRQPKLPEERDEQLGRVVLPAPRERTSADVKIVQVIQQFSSQCEPLYLHKDQIQAVTDLAKSTVENALSRLVKDGQLHRQTNEQGFEIRGMYGLGAAPAPEQGE